MAGFSVKSSPSKTQHPKKTSHPETLRASSPFSILALTSPVPSVSFLPQVPRPELLQEVLGCLLPVPQHMYRMEAGVPCPGPQLPCACLQHSLLLLHCVCFILAL